MRSRMLLAALAFAGCGTSHTGDTDAGRRDAGSASADAGLDATRPRPDASRPDATRPAVDSGPILPPVDAGDPFGDAGALGPPEWVPIDVLVDGSTCPPLVPCGGDEVGTWDVSGGCVEVPIGPELMRCPGAMVTRNEGRARGRVVFDGTFARRTGQSEAEIEVFVPSVCAMFAGGCAGIEAELRRQNPDSRCVANADRDCVCASRRIVVVDDADFYTIEGTQIVGSSTGRRWDYCVEGASLRYRDASRPTIEPGIVDLARR